MTGNKDELKLCAKKLHDEWANLFLLMTEDYTASMQELFSDYSFEIGEKLITELTESVKKIAAESEQRISKEFAKAFKFNKTKKIERK